VSKGWVVTTATVREGDGMMPENAAMRKVKWLPTPFSDVTIDLLELDDDDHSQHSDHTVAAIATNDNEDYEQIEVENDEDHNMDEVVDSDDEHGIPQSPFLATDLFPSSAQQLQKHQ
jgi:hypothetical protein